MHSVEPWQVLSETTLVDRRWLRLKQQHVRMPNGHEIEEFHLIQSPDWAAVLTLTPNDEVVLVRQYRHGSGVASLELPAGVIEPGEAELESAQRELREETGYVSRSWHPLFAVNTEPARHGTRAHFFVAEAARAELPPAPEASELISIELHPRSSLGALLDRGEISHGVHVAAILFAARRGFLRLD